MNKSLNKLLATVLVTVMLLGAMPMLMPRTSAALSAPAFWVVPDQSFNTGSTSLGYNFTETLWGAVPNDTFLYQAWVTFDPSMLQVVSVTPTNSSTLSNLMAPHSTGGFTVTIFNALGYVQLGESLTGDDYIGTLPGESSGKTATICTIVFTMTAAPAPGGNLTCQIGASLTPGNSYIDDPNLQDFPNLQSGFATYLYTWSQPPHAYPEIVNFTSNDFDMYHNWIVPTTLFNESIYINVDGGWFCTNASTVFVYNGTLLQVTNVYFNPLWMGPNTSVNNTGALGLTVTNPSTTPSGHVLIATVEMEIMTQGIVPPDPYGYADHSVRSLVNTTLYSSYSTIYLGGPLIPVDPQPATPDILVYALLTAAPPHLSVGSVTLGPNPVVGSTFDVPVTLHDVNEPLQHLIGIQFRLFYDPTIMEPVSVAEGPFLPAYAPFGTWEQDYFYPASDGYWGYNVLYGEMILPSNDTGLWQEPLPNGTGVVAIITFRVLIAGQSFGEANVTTPLTLGDEDAIGLDNMQDQNIVDIFLSPSIPGTLTITNGWYTNPVNPDWGARNIDLFGGAVNSGKGPLIYPNMTYVTSEPPYTTQQTGPYGQFPSPYGGQGYGAQMDLVEPQSQVYLWASVTYNYWPVQHKNVAFEIQEPDGTVYNKLSAFTDANGIAGVTFRMPWPCDDPESLFGLWKVTATVQLADVIINDTMTYHYNYMVNIWKVTTDMFQYNHAQDVVVTIDFSSYAAEYYPVLFLVSIVDSLGVTVGTAVAQTMVGGATNCQYKNYTVQVTIFLPKWAYAGIATVHVNGFDIEPADGGVAITPEYVPYPTIAIQPY